VATYSYRPLEKVKTTLYTETRSCCCCCCCCCNPFPHLQLQQSPIRKPSKKKLINPPQHCNLKKQQVKRNWLCRHHSPLIWGRRAPKNNYAGVEEMPNFFKFVYVFCFYVYWSFDSWISNSKWSSQVTSSSWFALE
jgi:hypothetical protein